MSPVETFFIIGRLRHGEQEKRNSSEVDALVQLSLGPRQEIAYSGPKTGFLDIYLSIPGLDLPAATYVEQYYLPIL